MNGTQNAALPPLGWLGIVRLGLVQTALGAVVVLTTAALNRVMVVEHALPASLPGVLVALHYAVQMLRPRLGHGSDQGGRRTPWIIGGMAVLGLGGVLAAVATAWMGTALVPGIALAVLAFLLVGLGVGAAGTSLLVLLAARVAPQRRPAAASLVWIMMIAGFVLTTAIAGRLLDPYSGPRLVAVAAGVAVLAFLLALLAVAGIEGPSAARSASGPRTAFGPALREVWAEPVARHFTIFVFVSMLAYSAQDLILEPFAGTVFGMTLGETTRLSSVQHGGVLAGMILIAIVGSLSGGRVAVLRGWILGGCLAAAALLVALAGAGMAGAAFPLQASFFALGLANGAFAAAAIASMMQLVSQGAEGRQGVRMGLFGAAQAIAFGAGGLAGTVVLDLGRMLTGSAGGGYVTVFLADAALFLAAALLARRIGRATADPHTERYSPGNVRKLIGRQQA
ncbi:BCD family MFS transporter [Falsiroseomonas selenitidurans]|uniref:BCD family MFS transporter n=1 Tax=Falsiroseomonas selenitidurans TaxID=2716335 RepID=A0ABX1ED48_9PROT|nr:BCD family MFS transporter [Falsiroseomonas selenitidurans]NKC33822.1 BCD family MFS transporter [Falsiroseomonas selenitidurans]